MAPNISFTGECKEVCGATATVFLGTYYGILGVLIIASNVVNLIALPHVVELCSLSVLLFRALAVVDLLTGIFVCGHKFVENTFGGDLKGIDWYCRASNALSTIFVHYSLLLLGCVSLYRFLKIAAPLRYSSFITYRRLKATILCLAIVGAVPVAVQLILDNVIKRRNKRPIKTCQCGRSEFTYILIIIPVIVTVIITITNLRVLIITYNQNRAMRKPGLQIVKSNGASVTKGSNPRMTKGMKTLLLVIICFYVCWAPVISLQTYRIVSGLTAAVPCEVFLASRALLITNSAVNSVIYLSTMKSFRRAVRKSMSCRLNPSSSSSLSARAVAVARQEDTLHELL